MAPSPKRMVGKALDFEAIGRICAAVRKAGGTLSPELTIDPYGADAATLKGLQRSRARLSAGIANALRTAEGMARASSQTKRDTRRSGAQYIAKAATKIDSLLDDAALRRRLGGFLAASIRSTGRGMVEIRRDLRRLAAAARKEEEFLERNPEPFTDETVSLVAALASVFRVHLCDRAKRRPATLIEFNTAREPQGPFIVFVKRCLAEAGAPRMKSDAVSKAYYRSRDKLPENP